MQCYRCNTPIPDDSKFCMSCGADVSDPSGQGGTTAAMDAAQRAELERLVRKEVGGEFELERELGRGGMAVVYLATEVHLGRKVAIKVLPPELTFGTGAIDRFKREARTAATLDHPNIIPVYRITPGGKLFWYAMKYLEGHSLGDLLKEKKRLALSETIEILDQVAAGLDYAHARNVIHRDVKPANVMLDAQNRVIVTDFGIAKQLAAGSFTASGSVIGTPYYMSPEQCTGAKTLTGAADQYSVGIMCYQMLAGQVPFEGESAIDILTKHCTQPPPPLDVLRPGLPKYVYASVEKALAKHPEERFTSTRALVEGLRGRSTELTASTRRDSLWARMKTTPVPGVAPRRRWSRVVALATVGGVVLGGGTLILLNSGPATRSTAGGAARDTLATRARLPAADSASRPRATAPDTTGAAEPPVAGPAPRGTSPAPPATGRLTIADLPRGGQVFINRQRQTGTRFDLRPGRHAVVLTAPGFETTVDTVTITAGDSTQLRFHGRELPAAPAPDSARPPPAASSPAAAAGILVVRTSGGWARIFVDGAFRREGSSYRDSLPAGTHTLRLEREGWVTIDTTVTVRAGQTEVVDVTMRRRGG